MNIKLLKPVTADGKIIPAGAIIRVDSPEVRERIIREGIGKPVDPADVWNEPMASRIHWFLNADLPEGPFSPCEYEHIFCPVTYYGCLRRDIDEGPTGPRARYGALQDDLQRLHDYCEGRDA